LGTSYDRPRRPQGPPAPIQLAPMLRRGCGSIACSHRSTTPVEPPTRGPPEQTKPSTARQLFAKGKALDARTAQDAKEAAPFGGEMVRRNLNDADILAIVYVP